MIGHLYGCSLKITRSLEFWREFLFLFARTVVACIRNFDWNISFHIWKPVILWLVNKLDRKEISEVSRRRSCPSDFLNVSLAVCKLKELSGQAHKYILSHNGFCKGLTITRYEWFHIFPFALVYVLVLHKWSRSPDDACHTGRAFI